MLQQYLPAALSEAELQTIIDRAIADTAASGIKDMGKVVAAVRPQVVGRADMGAVSGLIKARLGA